MWTREMRRANLPGFVEKLNGPHRLPPAGEGPCGAAARPVYSVFRQRLLWAVGWALLASIGLASVGCQSPGYRAGSLPPELAAGSMNAMPHIDLANLSNSSSFSDRIYTGDTLDITIATGVEQQPPTPWRVRVTPQGIANVPELGPVQLAGLKLTDAERSIYQESIRRQLYVNPHVTVTLNQRQTHRITVVGAVKQEGTFDIPAPSCDLSTALVHADGLADNHAGVVVIKQPREAAANQAASPSAVGLASFASPEAMDPNGQYQSSRINLKDLQPGVLNNLRLADGSVVEVIEQEPRTIQVLGLVRKPGRYEVQPNEEARLLDAIALAGGRSLQIADKVHVIRQAPAQAKPVVIQASIKAAKEGGDANLKLAAGDVVSVEETPTTFTVGMLQSFIRVGFSAAIPGF